MDNLIVTHITDIDTVGFPTLSMGDCKHLILDENLKIKTTYHTVYSKQGGQNESSP